MKILKHEKYKNQEKKLKKRYENQEANEIKLIYISTEHYEDFKKVKKDFL